MLHVLFSIVGTAAPVLTQLGARLVWRGAGLGEDPEYVLQTYSTPPPHGLSAYLDMWWVQVDAQDSVWLQFTNPVLEAKFLAWLPHANTMVRVSNTCLHLLAEFQT